MPMALVQPAHDTSAKDGRRRQPITACRTWTFFNLFSLFALLSLSCALLVLDLSHGVFAADCDNAGSELNDGSLRGCGQNVGIRDISELCLWTFVTTLFMCDLCVKRHLTQTARAEGDSQPRLLIPALPFIVRLLLCIELFFVSIRTRVTIQRLLITWFPQHFSTNWYAEGFYDGHEPVVASVLRVVRLFFCLVLVICGMAQRTMEVSQFDPQLVETEDEDEQEETKDRVVLEERQSREQGASICEQLTFTWTSKLLTAGYRAPLQISQIFLMRAEDGPLFTASLFSGYWEERVQAERAKQQVQNAKKKATGNADFVVPKYLLVKTLMSYFWKELGLSALLVLGQIGTSLLQPVLLNSLLHFIATPISPNNPVWVGYALASTMVFCQFLQNIMITQYHWILRNTGYRIRGALSVMIFRKAM